MNRRSLLFLLATAPLASCSFCYDEAELVGVYRARRTANNERLTLFEGGQFVHEWGAGRTLGWRTGIWSGEGCTIFLDNYGPPSMGEPGRQVIFIAGPPTFFGHKPTFHSFEIRVSYEWQDQA